MAPEQSVETKKYQKNFITNVIFRIDFPSISEFNSTKLKEFQKLINEEFPIVQEQKANTFSIPIGNKNIEANSFGELIWIFISKDQSRKVSLGENHLTLDLINYNSFEELYPKIELLVNSLFQIFPEVISSRIGLRYINEISLEGEDPYNFSNYINENLIKSLEFLNLEEFPLAKYISAFEIKGNDLDLTFRFGIPNSLYPNKIIRKEFVLDYDCSTTESLERDKILEKTAQFNNEITKIFEKSIEEGLRSEMGVL